MATIDSATGVITAEANSSTEQIKLGTAKVTVTLNGKTGSASYDVYQEGKEETPQEQNYTYQYSGNNYVTAKCYYKDASGNLLEQAVPSTGGNACLVLDYSVGVNRYLDGVFVDEVALTYGATLEALSYATFADDDCEWWEPTASALSEWTHNIQYSLGESIVRGASAVDMAFGEAPVPYTTTEKFVAVQFSGIKLKIPAGLLEGLGELTLECSESASLEQDYRDFGVAKKISYVFENSYVTLNDHQAGNISDLADASKVELAVYANMHTEATFENGTTVKGDMYDNVSNDTNIHFEDHSNNGLGTGLERIYLIDYPLGTFNKVIKEWDTSTFMSTYDINSFDVYLEFFFSQFIRNFTNWKPEEVTVIYNGAEYTLTDGLSIYPFETQRWTW